MRHVVVDEEAVEADLLERLDRLYGINVAVSPEHLGEVLDAADDVAQVDVEEPAATAEVADGVEDAFAAAHLGPAAVAEVEAVHRGVELFLDAPKVLEAYVAGG